VSALDELVKPEHFAQSQARHSTRVGGLGHGVEQPNQIVTSSWVGDSFCRRSSARVDRHDRSALQPPPIPKPTTPPSRSSDCRDIPKLS